MSYSIQLQVEIWEIEPHDEERHPRLLIPISTNALNQGCESKTHPSAAKTYGLSFANRIAIANRCIGFAGGAVLERMSKHAMRRSPEMRPALARAATAKPVDVSPSRLFSMMG